MDSVQAPVPPETRITETHSTGRFVTGIWAKLGVVAVILVVVFAGLIWLGWSVQDDVADIETPGIVRGAPDFRDLPLHTKPTTRIAPYVSVEEVKAKGYTILETWTRLGYTQENGSFFFYNGYKAFPVSGADTKTFAQYERTPYAADAENVYFAGAPMGADVSTFIAYEDTAYARDADVAYYNGKPIERADATTFTPLNYWYAKDGRMAFYGGGFLGADYATFQQRTDGVVVSKDGVYCFGKPERLEGVDSATLALIQSNEFIWLVADKRTGYDLRHCSVLSASGRAPDPASFRVAGNFGKDREHVFFFGDPASIYQPGLMLVPDVEVASFTQTFRAVRGDDFDTLEIGIGAEDATHTYEFYFDNKSDAYQWELRNHPK